MFHTDKDLHWWGRQSTRKSFWIISSYRRTNRGVNTAKIKKITTTSELETIIGVQCRPRNPNATVDGWCRKWGLPILRLYPLTSGCDFSFCIGDWLLIILGLPITCTLYWKNRKFYNNISIIFFNHNYCTRKQCRPLFSPAFPGGKPCITRWCMTHGLGL